MPLTDTKIKALKLSGKTKTGAKHGDGGGLNMALGCRHSNVALAHHSGRSDLSALGITVSMSDKGDRWDNSPMDSCNGTVTVECVNDEHFVTCGQARQAIARYIGYYSTERRHSALGDITPVEFERRWYAPQEVARRPGHIGEPRVTHRQSLLLAPRE